MEPRKDFSESSLDIQLRNWEEFLGDLPGLLKESRDEVLQDYYQHSNPEIIAAEHQRAVRQTERVEQRLKQYKDELDMVLAILPDGEMGRYCEWKERELREGLTDEIATELAGLRRGFDRAEKQAQSKINKLLAVTSECEVAVRLCRDHLKWIEALAWEHSIVLPEKAPASQVATDQQSNPRGAGRKRNENVTKRRNEIFKYIKTNNLQNAKILLTKPATRREIYQLLDNEKVEMIASEKFRYYKTWTELLDDPVDDLNARDALIRDLERNWKQLLEEHQT